MRNIVLLLVLVVGCGPSGRELGLAKAARYHGDKLVLFNAAKDVTATKYKLAVADETSLSFSTTGRWYTPEGLAAAEASDNMKNVPDKSISVAMTVKLLPDGDNWIVSVEPKMMRYIAGRPNPDILTPNDPSLPGWATGKVDQLQYDIHEALKQYEVKSLGGIPPAPTGAPAGSAAPTPPADPPAPDPQPQ